MQRNNKQGSNHLNEQINGDVIRKKVKHEGQSQEQEQTDLKDGNQIEVLINCLQTKMNLQYYFLTEQKRKIQLRQLLQRYVRQYLKKNVIKIHQKSTEINIMEEHIFSKSQDAGNYMFDPFCEAIQIKIKRRDGQTFVKSFQVVEVQKIKIITESILAEDWKNQMILKPEDQVQKLIIKLCMRRRQSKQTMSAVKKAFEQIGGCQKIQDLFSFSKDDYGKVKIKISWCYDFLEQIQKIKLRNSQILNFKLPVHYIEKQNCIRQANSHKTLRYLVYKLQNVEGLNKIPYINEANLEKAMQIVSKEIINEALLKQVQTYLRKFTFAAIQNQQLKRISRGCIFQGPPGTGKTQLSQLLPNLVGYHLIQKGLSSADFSKSLVGQSSRMVNDLCNRARLSPHLICCFAIDEVDGFVPDRKDKEQKNSQEGTSILLSLIDGNKDVPNLILFTSTNHIKKIDEAIRRRLGAQFHVGAPTSQARRKIILDELPYFAQKQNEQMFQYVIQITTNFTGAALKQLTGQFYYQLKNKQRKNNNRHMLIQQAKQKVTLKKSFIIKHAIKIAQKSGYRLGNSTLPQIFAARQTKQTNQSLFSEQYMSKMHNQFSLVQVLSQTNFVFYYANEVINQLQNGDRQLLYDIGKLYINLEDIARGQHQSSIELIANWIRRINRNKSYYNQFSIQVLERDILESQDMEAFSDILVGRQTKTILLIEGQNNNLAEMVDRYDIFRKRQNLYIFYLTRNLDNISVLNWKLNRQTNYLGRMLVQLKSQDKKLKDSSDLEMIFQTKGQKVNGLQIKKFLKASNNSKPHDVIPQIVDFFNSREVSYMLYIDQAFLSLSAVYNKQKIFELIQQKVSEAKNYKKSAIIIDVDSLIPLSYTVSDSSMGKSSSEGIADNQMFLTILNLLKAQATIDNLKNERWITAIIKNEELARILKISMNWPLTIKEKQKIQKQVQNKKDKQCKYCKVKFTQRDNQKEWKCMQHPEYPINLKHKNLSDTSSYHQMKIHQYKYAESQAGNTIKKMYVYACCLKDLDSPGQKAYKHVAEGDRDQLNIERRRLKEKSLQTVERICK